MVQMVPVMVARGACGVRLGEILGRMQPDRPAAAGGWAGCESPMVGRVTGPVRVLVGDGRQKVVQASLTMFMHNRWSGV